MKRKMFKWAFLLTASLFFTFAVLCQPSVEGFDPLMRQISAQAPHPNIGIALDASMYMLNDAVSQIPVGVDSTGYPYWKYDGCYNSTSWANVKALYGNIAYPGPTSGNYKYIHIYWLVGGRPSRMAIVKNALGNSVTIFNWTPPTTYPNFTGWTHPAETVDGIPWYWVATKTNSQPSPPSTLTIPTGCPTSAPTCPVGGILSWQCPRDLIGQTKNMVNWGLVVNSTTQGNCDIANIICKFDLTDSGDVTAIENAMKLNRDGGITCSGYPNTRGVLKFMKSYFSIQASGGNLTDFNGTIHNLPQDTKFFTCNRPYGAILIAGTGSSACNEGDSATTNKDWINPCGTGMYTCNGGPGTFDCDRGTRYPSQTTPNVARYYSRYPAGRIDELWNATASDGTELKRLNVRTWVIGVESLLNRCEINFCAYMGRTDASAPEGDAGYNTTADADRLPHMQADWSLADNEEDVSHYNDNDPRVTGKNYAYFAPSSLMFQTAFTDIYNGLVTGNYAASSLVGTPASAGGGYIAFLPTAELPKWKGHLYAFDTNAEPSVLVYDAATVLNAQTSASRKIFTWDSSNALVPVESGRLSDLQTIAAAFTPGFTAANLTSSVVDFIIGNNGSGADRGWKLGPIMNSTPSIIGIPGNYKQPTVDASHATFASTYAIRKPLLYVGSDDGMLHCFLITKEEETNPAYVPGHELFAVIPPNLLSKQVDLYNNYVTKNMITGQNKEPREHIFGVANSFRYSDVYFGNGEWKTVLFLTEGPGGSAVAAIDVTDPFGKMTKSSPEDPVSILWNYTSATCTELKNSWSLPAIGSTSSSGFVGVMGTGYDTISTVTQPYMLIFDPTDGTMVKKALTAASTSYVRNQAFCNSVVFKTDMNGFYSDNIVNLALQADLHGRIWFYKLLETGATPTIGIPASGALSGPVYYPPAVSGYKKGTTTYDLYAFATGTYYEKDPDITGSSSTFVPTLYCGIKTPWGTDNTGMTMLSQTISSITYDTGETSQSGHPVTANISSRARVIAPPLLLTPVDESTDPQVIFEVYDPATADCGGTTFIITMKIDFSGSSPSLVTHGFNAGAGAASGFTIIGGKIVVAHSGIGQGAMPSVSKASNVNLNISAGVPLPNWWRELQ